MGKRGFHNFALQLVVADPPSTKRELTPHEAVGEFDGEIAVTGHRMIFFNLKSSTFGVSLEAEQTPD